MIMLTEIGCLLQMSRKPDYIAKAMNKATGEKSWRIGCAWHNSDGSVSVKVDPFIVLTGGEDLVVTLFPNEEK